MEVTVVPTQRGTVRIVWDKVCMVLRIVWHPVPSVGEELLSSTTPPVLLQESKNVKIQVILRVLGHPLSEDGPLEAT